MLADMPPLVADGGELTIMRRTANFVFGEWRVTSEVDGLEVIVPDEKQNHGYLYRPVGAPAGRFDVGFVRMDASIELDRITLNSSGTKATVTSGRSDVELQMDAGQLRSEGRVLVQREITARGLGRVVPGVDFTTGDIIPILLWGKVLRLPATAVDWVVQPGGRMGFAVRAGGQLIQDAEQLRSLNSEAQAQIDAERRRAQEEAKRLEEQAERDRAQTREIDAIAREGRSTANTANSTANTARTNARKLGDFSDDVYSTFNGFGSLSYALDAMRDAVSALNALTAGSSAVSADLRSFDTWIGSWESGTINRLKRWSQY